MFQKSESNSGLLADSKIASATVTQPASSILATVVAPTAEARAKDRFIGKYVEWSFQASKYTKLPKALENKLPLEYDVFVIAGQPSLEVRANIRRDLVRNFSRAALVQGTLAGQYTHDLELVHQDEFTTSRARSALKRNGTTLVEYQSPFVTFDIDGLDGRKIASDFDARVDLLELPNLLQEYLIQIGAEFLICDCVIQISSSYGLYDGYSIRCHIEYLPDAPFSLSQQKVLAERLNEASRKHGFGTPFDERIYSAEHLLYTAPPTLVKRVSAGSKDFVERLDRSGEIAKISDRFDPLERVLLVKTCTPRLKVDPCLLAATKAEKVSNAHNLNPSRATKSNKAIRLERESTLAEIREGNTHEPILRLIGSIANEPKHRAPAILEYWRRRSEARIRETSAYPKRAEDRIRDHASPEAFDQMYDATVAKWIRSDLGIVIAKGRAASPTLPSVDAFRSELSDRMSKLVSEALEFERDETALLPAAAPTSALIIPPGVGKTHSVGSALDTHQTADKKVVWLAPTTKLAEESLARRQTGSPSAKLFRGRKALCTAPESLSREAERLERAGISPRTVCEKCPKKNDCAYFIQGKELASENFMMHAHAFTTFAKQSEEDAERIDLLIADESLVPSVLSATRDETDIELAELRKVVRRAKRNLKRSGRQDAPATADLLVELGKLMKVCDAAEGRISRKSVIHLWCEVPSSNADEAPNRRVIDDIQEQCLAWAWDLRERLTAIASELIAAHVANREVLTEEQAARLQDLRVAMFFLSLIRAIRATLQTHGREHVLGVRIYSKGSERIVHVHLRKPWPRALRHVPMILLDGTARPKVLSAALQGREISFIEKRPAIPTGAYHLTQCLDRPFGKGGLIAADGGATGLLLSLWRFICVEAARDWGSETCAVDGKRIDVLVVVQKDVEAALRGLGLPSNVEVRHFGTVRGLNEFKYAKCAIVIGRPMPEISVLEDHAEALAFDDPSVLDIKRCTPKDRFRSRRALPMADGREVFAPIEGHPDEFVSDLIQAAIDDEPAQAVARLRFYDRTTSNPAQVFVFGHADVGVPIHEVITMRDAERDAIDLMIEKGVVFPSRALAAIACPDGWVRDTGPGRAEFSRAAHWLDLVTGGVDKIEGKVLNATYNSISKDQDSKSDFVHLAFRPSSGRLEHAWIHTRRHPDPQAAISAALGEPVEIVTTAAKKGKGRPKAAEPSRAALLKRQQRQRKKEGL